jgi:PBP1b-binding outer membrane lipoprotein LpoB
LSWRGVTRSVVAALLALALFGLAGCGQPPATAPSANAFPSRPATPQLATPEDAVRSYLAWTSYAYRMANSDIATPTMSPDEEVRVNSFVELNNEQQRVINQVLDSIDFRKLSVVGTTTIVPTSEKWQYSYISKKNQQSISPTFPVSYDATYTVIQLGKNKWVVDSVLATVTAGEIH